MNKLWSVAAFNTEKALMDHGRCVMWQVFIELRILRPKRTCALLRLVPRTKVHFALYTFQVLFNHFIIYVLSGQGIVRNHSLKGLSFNPLMPTPIK